MFIFYTLLVLEKILLLITAIIGVIKQEHMEYINFSIPFQDSLMHIDISKLIKDHFHNNLVLKFCPLLELNKLFKNNENKFVLYQRDKFNF